MEFINLLAAAVLGVLSGLLPGFHVNNAAALLFPFLSHTFESVWLIGIMAILALFFDLFTQQLTGVPFHESAALNVIQEQKTSILSIQTILFSALSAIVLSLPVILMVGPFLAQHFFFFQSTFPLIIMIGLLGIIFTHDPSQRLFAFLTIIASGLVGFVVLSNPKISDPLSCLMISFLAIPTLLLNFSLQSHSTLVSTDSFSRRDILPVVYGCFFALWMMVLPGMSPAYAIILSSSFFPTSAIRDQLIRLVSVASANVVYGFWGIVYLNAPRNGTAVYAQQLFQLDWLDVFSLHAGLILLSVITCLLVLFLHEPIVQLLQQFNMRLIQVGLLVVLLFFLFFKSGFFSWLVVLIAFPIVLFSQKRKIRPVCLMGFLSIPLLFRAISS